MSAIRLTALMGVALVVAACGSSVDRNARIAKNQVESPVTDSPSPSNVRLKIVQRTDETLFMQLRNDSDHPIFVSYVPPSDGAETTFLTYSLQKRTARDADFREYGEALHHVPNLHPINARSAITFHLISYPSEKGEYRVRVGYYDDEEIYKMVSERLIEMTATERDKATRASKYVLSESFSVSPTPPKYRKR
jgi:hypothetical protein